MRLSDLNASYCPSLTTGHLKALFAAIATNQTLTNEDGRGERLGSGSKLSVPARWCGLSTLTLNGCASVEDDLFHQGGDDEKHGFDAGGGLSGKGAADPPATERQQQGRAEGTSGSVLRSLSFVKCSCLRSLAIGLEPTHGWASVPLLTRFKQVYFMFMMYILCQNIVSKSACLYMYVYVLHNNGKWLINGLLSRFYNSGLLCRSLGRNNPPSLQMAMMGPIGLWLLQGGSSAKSASGGGATGGSGSSISPQQAEVNPDPVTWRSISSGCFGGLESIRLGLSGIQARRA